MILDTLENCSLYYPLNPRLRRAFEFLRTCDPMALPLGRNDIDGDEIFVNVSELELKPHAEALLELHRRYLDIQVLATDSVEEFGWSAKGDVKSPRDEFSVEKDIQFFTDRPQTIYAMRRGQFSIFTPEDAHAPMLGSGHVRKLIVKVLI